MENYITTDELRNLEVTGDDKELEKLANELNEKVAELVGEEIISSLTPDDVDVLANMQDKASEEEIAKWIAEHVPDYQEMIEDNKAIVLGDFAESQQ